MIDELNTNTHGTTDEVGNSTADLSPYSPLTASAIAPADANSGSDVTELTASMIVYKRGYSPYISEDTGTWFEYSEEYGGFVDTGVKAGSESTVDDVTIGGVSIVDGGVAKVPLANTTTAGVLKIASPFSVNPQQGTLALAMATAANVKAGTENTRPIASNLTRNVAFYGLAKAAGDSTQSASSNAIGLYTETAMQKVQEMLGIVVLTQAEYDALTVKSPSTIYFIKED